MNVRRQGWLACRLTSGTVSTIAVLLGLFGVIHALLATRIDPHYAEGWLGPTGVCTVVLALLLALVLRDGARALMARAEASRCARLGSARDQRLPIRWRVGSGLWLLPRASRFKVTVAALVAPATLAGGAALMGSIPGPQQGVWRAVAITVAGFALLNALPVLPGDGAAACAAWRGEPQLRRAALAALRDLLAMRVALRPAPADPPHRRTVRQPAMCAFGALCAVTPVLVLLALVPVADRLLANVGGAGRGAAIVLCLLAAGCVVRGVSRVASAARARGASRLAILGRLWLPALLAAAMGALIQFPTPTEYRLSRGVAGATERVRIVLPAGLPAPIPGTAVRFVPRGWVELPAVAVGIIDSDDAQPCGVSAPLALPEWAIRQSALPGCITAIAPDFVVREPERYLARVPGSRSLWQGVARHLSGH